eukprot:276820-Pelagomonas_calceolata.AAC.6
MAAGCSVSELWRLLEAKLPLPSGHVTALTDTVKQYIWVSLLQQRPLDILLYLPSGTSPHEPRSAGRRLLVFLSWFFLRENDACARTAGSEVQHASS